MEIAELLNDTPNGLTESTLVFLFTLAFPDLPFRTLRDACGWHRVTNGGLTDDEFSAMLSPWLGKRS